MGDFLSQEELSGLDAYWRASNYLAVGQIYLKDNPLLKVPLSLAHIKPRLLGHWGTTPGLNLIYTHLNRLINQYDLNMLFVAGPGHGGPAVVAQTYLEGTFTECWPAVEQNTNGCCGCFGNFHGPMEFPAMFRRWSQVRSTRGANWATAWPMPMAPRLITRT